RIHLQSGQKGEWERLLAILHVFDHMQRLHERCTEETDRATTAKQTEHLAPYSRLLAESIVMLQQHMQDNQWHEMLELSQRTNRTIEQETQPYRETMVQKMALGQLPVPQGTQYLEAMRWLRRVSRHIARISQHYRDAVLAIGKKA
ncbi:MAG: Na/Pi cotransporter family protein, partial [Gammaproteobacteria bacterium]|nr:Na/Pi cotransporter family protein [Gammaproteobacteria bacterium]